MNDRENYYQQHRCCPRCGGQSFEQQLGRHIPHLAGEPYRDHGGTTCNGCGWKGTVHDLRPEGLTVDEVLAKPAEPAGPQLEEEPETVDALIQELRRQEQALGEERSARRIREYRQLVKEYLALLSLRMCSLDLEATHVALRIVKEIKDTGEREPSEQDVAELRILCGTKHAVPATLSRLYEALHGYQEEAARLPVDRRAEPENLAPSWDRYKSLAAASPAARMVAQQAAEIRAADHPPGQVRCATCGKVADMSRELGGSAPVPPDGWGIVPSVDGILCPECLAAERRLQRP